MNHQNKNFNLCVKFFLLILKTKYWLQRGTLETN